MDFDINKLKGREPLEEYPWRWEIDRLLEWVAGKDSHLQAFCFDLVMSAAYIDATSGWERNIEACSNSPQGYNAHLGFINLCSPCFEKAEKWQYQKAAKPLSGALGKLSSEVILRFIEKLYPQFQKVMVVGGTELADAILIHSNETVILAEVKSAPLLTYPFIFKVKDSQINGEHEKLTITNSQLRECDSGIYLHGDIVIDLGAVGERLWPFKPMVDYLINPKNEVAINNSIETWLKAKQAYCDRDKTNSIYFLTNASGRPPNIARERDAWPQKESISDSKTSAGMDRTDDIKKGIYQTLKIGTHIKENPNYKTAIISNLPAYRHGEEYVAPFVNMLWGMEDDIQDNGGIKSIELANLRRVFDFIITLENPILRQEL
jgi:hypothetical protein